jgi:xanthine dehydrogenase accessory factor
MTANVYSAILDAQATGQSAALCTVIRASGSVPRHATSKMLVYADGRFVGTIGGGEMESRTIKLAKEVARSGQAQILEYNLVDPKQGDPGVCGGTVEIFVEPINPPPQIIIVGAGHVGRATAHLAKWLGFRVIVNDDRADLVTTDWIPEADRYLPGPLDEHLAEINFNAQTYVLLLTRGVQFDVALLPKLLDSDVAYIGVIGSRRRWTTALKQLREQGLLEDKLARIHSPIGLELRAETPEEIAVSIMAEIIMRRNGGTGQSMKMLDQPNRSDVLET